ncbi:hypothetical protein PV724_44540 [Streptomyces europaeiscabiei]|uniref:hypothetical protein n=1 Tax=Streptomyces europaeiscabiei TaxID=146819 RepID=UPI0029A8FC00|nr:hypothetical protein [Streptomyces europaeiscabiei]MDX3549547.1 hypothetical protein [Streptomyces europaeiscabiei]
MTVSLLPVRLDLRRRPTRKHRAVDEVTRLRGFLAGAHQLINGLQLQLDEADARHAVTAAKQAEAELLVVQQQADIEDLTAERDVLLAEVLRFRARFGPQLAAEANTHRIDVPPMIRDTSAIEDQATDPIGINVTTLREAAAAGRLGPVTDPGHGTTL